MIGSTISHYKILEKLGEGGMGVVYKVHDTKLDRTIALKFLPRSLEAHEPERARFLQEAKAASALNHPNICTVHDLQEHEGQQFIVMEYVDGKTLREIILGSTISSMTAIAYAVQIGEALSEAHSHGIVHRDVKPENIMVNTKNQIKVMDFGLAKLKGTLKLTRTSSTVGTLAYMAPEQIQGGEADGRSDIFSFGIVLFEMLSGHLPFRGEHEAALMYSIVNEEPDPLERYKPEVSPLLANIVQRALEKDPEERYQSAGDMVIELRRLQKKSTKVTRRTGVGPAGAAQAELEAPAPAMGKRLPKKALWAGIGIVVILVAAFLLFRGPSPGPALNPDMTFRVLQMPFTQVGLPGLSRDGNWAAFPAADASGTWDIYFMNTTSGEPRRVTSDSSIYVLSADVSPDGSQIAYERVTAKGTDIEIAIVSSLGGPSRKVTGVGYFPRWRPDGQRIGYTLTKNYGSKSGVLEIWSVRPNGSDNRCELIDSVSATAIYYGAIFAWSPDGRSICWARVFPKQYQEVMVCELSTGKMTQLTFDEKIIDDMCWAPNNQIIFSSNRSGNTNLWMVPAPGGEATQLTKGSGPDLYLKISRDGSKLLYLQQQPVGHIWAGNMDGKGPRQITFDDADINNIALTPDGKEILFDFAPQSTTKPGAAICSIGLDGANRRMLTSGEDWVHSPLVSPDGRWLIYGGHTASEPHESTRVCMTDFKNPGTPRIIGRGVPTVWIDEKSFLSQSATAYNSWISSIDGTEPRKLLEDSTYPFPVLGGKYICYGDMRAGREGIWITAAPGVKDPRLPAPRRMTSLNVKAEVDQDGRFFYYVNNSAQLCRISLPYGKDEVVRGTFPGLNLQSSLEINSGRNEIAYTDTRISGKLVMIENLFK